MVINGVFNIPQVFLVKLDDLENEVDLSLDEIIDLNQQTNEIVISLDDLYSFTKRKINLLKSKISKVLGLLQNHIDNVAPHTGHATTDAGGSTTVATGQTIQEVINSLSDVYSGDMTVNIPAGTYVEDVGISGISMSEGAILTIKGNENTTNKTANGGSSGTISTRATITGEFVLNAEKNKWVKFTSGANNGLWRVIDSNTTAALTLSGGILLAPPANGDTYDIIYNDTLIDGGGTGLSLDATGMSNLVLENLSMPRGFSFKECIISAKYCDITTHFHPTNSELKIYSGFVGGQYVLEHCIIKKSAAVNYIAFDTRAAAVQSIGSKFTGFTDLYGALFRGGGFHLMQQGSVFDNSAVGCVIDSNSHVYMHTGNDPTVAQKIFVNNNTTGISVLNGAGCANATTACVYTGNTTNYTADINSWYS